MKKQIIKTAALMMIAASLITILPGCAAKKEAWGNLKNGMIMKYELPGDKDLRYHNTFSFDQGMEIRGQQINVKANGNQTYMMKPLSSNNGTLSYSVTLEDMESVIQTPRGEMKADVAGIIGKTFQLDISPMGKELDYSGSEALIYSYGGGQSKSLADDMQAFFPDLADHPVKTGDTWESKDVITEKSSSGQMVLDITSLNTFEKLETFNGYECMKINIVFTGTMKGSSQENGTDLFTEGDLSGTGTWYFAYKEGIFVHQRIEGVGNTTTKVKGPEEMTLPATRKYAMESSLMQ
ncbi:MAG TPA: hypothetical protein VK994_06790 [Bacteroidales bacterium]|nr:hypothetical protein [Bacteroidales bacterium]